MTNISDEDPWVAERQSLLVQLLDAVKQCQIRYGGRTELAYENDSRVVTLCNQLEAIFTHGLKKFPFSNPAATFGKQVTEIVRSLHSKQNFQINFWECVRQLLNKHDVERYMKLKCITSDVGRGRAWLRSTLNERSLERYLRMLLSDPALLSQFYEKWAFLLDQERSSILPTMAAGLGSIVFATNINNPALNPPILGEGSLEEPQPIITATAGVVKRKKKKRPSSQIISFDDNLMPENDQRNYLSAPPTCVSSPVSIPQQEDEYGSDMLGTSSSSKHSPEVPTLTPLDPIGSPAITNLIPVSHLGEDAASDDSLSIPSFGEDTENAAAALVLAQKVANWPIDAPSSISTASTTTVENNHRPPVDALTMTTEELRDALLAVLQGKEEAEEKNCSLRSLLDQEMERNAALRAEFENYRKLSEEKVEKLEQKIAALLRESDLLKHQLKKYISAVQLLKRDCAQGLEGVLGEIVAAAPDSHLLSVVEARCEEAAQYQQKLVQVAEMHGELMEFNERLHRRLAQKEAALRHLREELIELRGPLPDGNQTSDDDISATSDYDNCSQSSPRTSALINVWIPSAFLAGRPPDVHHVYQVFVRIRDEEWNVYRRYRQFHRLHRALRRSNPPLAATLDLPPKKALGRRAPRLVEERRIRLQHYLRCLVNWLIQAHPELASAPDRDTFVHLLPFFGDERPHPSRGQPSRIASSSDPSHYMGL